IRRRSSTTGSLNFAARKAVSSARRTWPQDSRSCPSGLDLRLPSASARLSSSWVTHPSSTRSSPMRSISPGGMFNLDYRPMGRFLKVTSGISAVSRYPGTAMASSTFELLAAAVPAIAPHVVRGLMATCSTRVLGREVKEKYVDGSGGGFVGVVWHKNFLFALDFFR